MEAIATHLRLHLGSYLEGQRGEKKANLRKAGDLNHTPLEYTARQLSSRIFFRTNFNAHFNMNIYVTLSSTCFGP